ncbi:hypothetical protein [Streptomyces goshikiensis]|uniref:hypothetical protein n=1 Tax=Streptomyces goshikiensis TaxID=1942 RepID=UPI0036489222
MFIRPVGVTVSAAVRPAGRPLLRGLLARAATGTPPGYGGGGRSRSAEQSPGAYAYGDADADAYGEEPPEPEPDDAWEPGRRGYPTHPPYPEQAGAYAEEPPYPEPDDADWPEPAEPGAEPAEPGAVGRAAEPYAGLPAELAQLAGLAREGLLTPEEFAAAKALLLHP